MPVIWRYTPPVRNARRDDQKLGPLVIEIAVTSPALDRANATLYAEAGIQEYWIVLGNERRVEVYRGPEKGLYREQQLHDLEAVLNCGSVLGLRIRLSDLFA